MESKESSKENAQAKIFESCHLNFSWVMKKFEVGMLALLHVLIGQVEYFALQFVGHGQVPLHIFQLYLELYFSRACLEGLHYGQAIII